MTTAMASRLRGLARSGARVRITYRERIQGTEELATVLRESPSCILGGVRVETRTINLGPVVLPRVVDARVTGLVGEIALLDTPPRALRAADILAIEEFRDGEG